MVKVAVMMPAHNAEKYIEDAINSILRQRDAAEFDVIVVNDGSTDSTPEIVRRMANDATEIRLIDTPGQGVAQARNVALEALAHDTDYVAFLDSDDLSPAGRFARDLARFAADPALEVFYGSYRMFNATGADRFAPDPEGPFEDVRGVQLGAGLFGYSFLRGLGSFDSSLEQSEDLDFLFRIFENGPRYALGDEICVYYRRHGANMTRHLDVVRREFARALMRSMHRRKKSNAAGFPSGIFELYTNVGDVVW